MARDKEAIMILMKQRQNDLDFPTWFGRPFPELPTVWRDLPVEPTLKVEEFEDGDTVVVRAEMPGMDPDKDVEIMVSEGRLHIRAVRHAETKTEDAKGFRTEFQYGSFERTMRLPTGAAEGDVTASYKDGILEVRIPIDTAKAEAKRVTVARS
jgi:HSP20 family protein